METTVHYFLPLGDCDEVVLVYGRLWASFDFFGICLPSSKWELLRWEFGAASIWLFGGRGDKGRCSYRSVTLCPVVFVAWFSYGRLTQLLVTRIQHELVPMKADVESALARCVESGSKGDRLSNCLNNCLNKCLSNCSNNWLTFLVDWFDLTNLLSDWPILIGWLTPKYFSDWPVDFWLTE